MSASPSKADMCGAARDVRYGPKADICGVLLDHLIGTTNQGERCVKAESLRGLEIDNHLKLRGLDDRKVGRVLSLEDSARIGSNLPKQVGIVGAIADQTASRSKFAIRKDRRYTIASRQSAQLLAPA